MECEVFFTDEFATWWYGGAWERASVRTSKIP